RNQRYECHLGIHRLQDLKSGFQSPPTIYDRLYINVHTELKFNMESHINLIQIRKYTIRMLKYVTILILCSGLGHITYASPPNEYFQRGVKYFEEGRYSKALQSFDKALQSQTADADPNWFAEIHFQKATAYRALEEHVKAVSEYKAAIALNPNSAVFYNALGITHSELKQYNAALNAYKKALQLSPMTAEPHYNIGLVYLKQGAFPLAVDAFKEAVTIDAKWSDAHSGLAEAYLKQGLLSQAEKSYVKAVRLNPSGIGANLGLGQVYAKQTRYDDAITKFKKVIDIQHDNTDAHYQLAQIYIKLGEKEKSSSAMEFFKILRHTDPLLQKAQKWIKIHPDDPKGYNNLGIVYLTRKRYDKAIESYKHAISLSPTLASSHYNLGLTYHKQGNIKLAIEAYQKAISADATLAIAHNNIAVCYTESQADLKKALSHAQTATDLAPTEANYWDTLATVYTQLGLNSEAKHARQKQVSLLTTSKK
ncbi:MAG: tetratricopeptide repeat protein, partial [Candidatus Poribacteria bacterium]|nr:tetratricopeptide repeat protein [Candidatus Poribacteria bacterium]